MLLVITMDSPDGGASAWRYYPIGNTVYAADTLIPVPPDLDFAGATAPIPSPDRYYDAYDTGQGNCAGGFASFPLPGTTEFYMSFEGHQAYVAPVVGEPWNGGIGCALFRGEPTVQDIEFWGDYFFNDWVPPATPPVRYTGGNDIRVDATHVYHTFLTNGQSLVPLPGATLPATVDVLTVGGGGEGEDEGSFPRTRPTGGGAGGEAFITLGHTAPTVGAEMNIGSGGSGSGTNTQYDFTGLNTITANGGREGGSTISGDGGDQFGGGNTGGAQNGNAGGGGAGATGNGSAAPNSSQGGDGGPGLVSDWWEGVSREFGKGGGGAGNDDTLGVVPGDGGWPTASRERGGGGRGANWIAASEVFGGEGLIVVRYPRADI